MDAAEWNDDGTITIDTTLERIVNEKNDMHVLKEKLEKRSNTDWTRPYITSPPYQFTNTAIQGTSNTKSSFI